MEQVSRMVLGKYYVKSVFILSCIVAVISESYAEKPFFCLPLLKLPKKNI